MNQIDETSTGKQSTLERRHGATRREILELLRRVPGLTADQLAEELGITAMAIRKHLAALQTEGVLTARVERRPIGRPVHIYALAPTAQALFPQQYQELTTQLLDDLRSLDGEDKVLQLFQRRAKRLYDQLAPTLDGQPLPDQLATLASYLDTQGYLAEWEAVPNGEYLLKEHNCAIYGVAQCAPEVCGCELDLFRSLLPNAEIEREQHVIGGDHLCCYRLRLRD